MYCLTLTYISYKIIVNNYGAIDGNEVVFNQGWPGKTSLTFFPVFPGKNLGNREKLGKNWNKLGKTWEELPNDQIIRILP